jgi:LPXTG-motif cell wall-anchored protein
LPSQDLVLGRNSMTWLLIATVVVAGFALLKVRRRRKAREAGSSYADSQAA